MNVWRSAQLYRRRNQASQDIPRPEAMLLEAIALCAYGSTLKMEPGLMENTAVSTLEKGVSIRYTVCSEQVGAHSRC